MKLAAASLQEANVILSALFSELESSTVGPAGASIRREVALDMRYVGQEHTLTVPVEACNGTIDTDSGPITDGFGREYTRIFGHIMEEEVEIVHIRATLRVALARLLEWSDGRPAHHDSGQARTFEAYSFSRSTRLPFTILERATLRAGSIVLGPAIISEETATTYVDADFTARVDRSGCLFVTSAA
jgi:N-methylhydantoinase A